MHRRRAFTLVELIVVISLIAMLGAGFGLALTHSGPSHEAAQRSLFSIAQGLRGQAALKNEATALLVVGNQSKEGFLQRLDYAIAVPGTENTWKLTGASEWLPKDIFLVPAADHPLVASKIITLEGGADAWEKIETKGLKKDEATAAKRPVVKKPDGGTELTTYYKILEAKNDGKLKIDGKVALAQGHRTGSERITLTRPDAVLGLESSDYGAPLFLTGKDDFE